jgi:hypothetical protein
MQGSRLTLVTALQAWVDGVEAGDGYNESELGTPAWYWDRRTYIYTASTLCLHRGLESSSGRGHHSVTSDDGSLQHADEAAILFFHTK